MGDRPDRKPELRLILGGRERRHIQKQVIRELARLPGTQNLALVGELKAQLAPRGKMSLASKPTLTAAADCAEAAAVFRRRLRICRLAVAVLGSWKTARTYLWDPSAVLEQEVPIIALLNPDRECEVRSVLIDLGNLFRELG